MSEHSRSEKNKSKMQTSVSTDSLESRRWIFQADGDDDGDDEDENDVEFDEDLPPQHVLDSDEDENVDFKLIRTEPKIDSFDVEALEVPGVQRNDYEVYFVRKFIFIVILFIELGIGVLIVCEYLFTVLFIELMNRCVDCLCVK